MSNVPMCTNTNINAKTDTCTDMQNAAQEQCRFLKSMIEQVEKSLSGLPEGTLKIMQSPKKQPRYYHRLPGSNSRSVYIRKENTSLYTGLAQKDYNRRLLKLLKKKYSALLQFAGRYPFEDIDGIYKSLSPQRQALVKPIIPTDEQYAEQWQKTAYQGLGFRADDTSACYTAKGERVRSKSETIIADTLYRADIPYKYECPLELGNRTIYPDFTILHVRTRKEIYFEHFGMIDDPEYVDKMLQKINTYILCGIIPGKNLLYTMESSERALDTRILKRLIKEHLSS